MQKPSIFIVINRNESAPAPACFFIDKFVYDTVFSGEPLFQRIEIVDTPHS